MVSVLHCYEGTWMRVPWPLETKEGGRQGSDFSNWKDVTAGIVTSKKTNLAPPQIQSEGDTIHGEMATHLGPYPFHPVSPSRSLHLEVHQESVAASWKVQRHCTRRRACPPESTKWRIYVTWEHLTHSHVVSTILIR